jgi:hypothetical protein
MTLSCNHIALKVADLERCERFYTNVLGMRVTERHQDETGTPRSVWFDCDGTILMLELCETGKTARKDEAPGWHLLAFDIPVEKRNIWKEELDNFGVKITSETRYSIYFSDPEGNRLALSHYPKTLEEK